MNFESLRTVGALFRRLRRVRQQAEKITLFSFLFLVFAVVFSVPAGTKTNSALAFASRTEGTRTSAGRRSNRATDSGYVAALGAANRFLQAWQNQDHETGLLMLTDDAKEHSSEDHLESFFASGGDSAYEIARGRKMKDGRYSFPVTLFPFRPVPLHPGAARPDRPQKSAIVVVQAGKDEWAIDRLP